MNKMMIFVTDAVLVFAGMAVHGQQVENVPVAVIKPFPLFISCLETTNLIFPYAIKSVDRGSSDVLARKARGVANILQIKAAKADFERTNLTVITAEGHLYSYLLEYAQNPARLNFVFGKTGGSESVRSDSATGPALFAPGEYNAGELVEAALRVAEDKRSVFGVRDKSYGILMKLEGVYVQDDVLYYRILLQNRSPVAYDIGGFRFSVLDRRRYKRTASQEVEIKPVYILNDTTSIRANSRRRMVFALPKFTFPDNKYLLIRLSEKDGGRDLELKVHERTIMKAKPVQSQGHRYKGEK